MIDDSADTARPLNSSDRASPSRACSKARLSRTTSTPLTPMSAIEPTAAKAVSPSHVPYPTSPRWRMTSGTKAREQKISDAVAR